MTEQLPDISRHIWNLKYRLRGPDDEPLEATPADSWARVAQAAALGETPSLRSYWADEFSRALNGFRFLPAGRILSGAGTGRNVTLFNCFVMGTIPDDMRGIFDALSESALTLQAGGGIGLDFSSLRPKGALVRGVGADASGPVSFMDVWDAMCRTIMSAGARRGAMMGCLRCDHPDIEEFVEAKRNAQRLRNFNLSVLVSDRFMEAVEQDLTWDLVFEGRVHGSVQARALWDRIMASTYAHAEPGVIFIDRVNRRNPLSYCERISATNPCGEQPLPPYGACLLGSLNLAFLVKDPFTEHARINEAELDSLARTAVRFLDNVIDVSRYPLPAQEREARAKRRIGLGVTGLADALILCGARYGSAEAVNLTERWLKAVRRAAILASTVLSVEKGSFPLFEREAYLKSPAVIDLDADLKQAIAERGIRNGLVTSIAPTGTISLFAHNVSSGIEPVFSYRMKRRITDHDGIAREVVAEDYAYRLFRERFGPDAPLPTAFVDAQALKPEEHIAIQAAAQRHVDSSISKTVNVPRDMPFDEFSSVYSLAYRSGCKGCTTFRPNEVTGSVLSVAGAPQAPVKAGPAPPSHEDAIKANQAPPSKPLTETPVQGSPTPVQAPVVPAPVRAAEATMSGTTNSGPPLVQMAQAALKIAPHRTGAPTDTADIVYMTRPLDRPNALPGATYKVRWPDSDHAMYITINDIVENGRRRPFEIFINSKNMEHYAWTVALTRMISAVFRRGGDVSFVVEELKAVFDPRGGQWMDRRYVPSILAAIGRVIEEHLIAIGFLVGPLASEPVATLGDAPDFMTNPPEALDQPGRPCPRCHSPSLIRSEGCDACTQCGYSRCG